ncbi:relaxase/mobilization nuclease domain-containing protein [Dyadobacter subterraneus]|uniref:Relaxase/mobilization nuclease domain-containing protein n=2 Tax=Dyadobacter subterraneus TaxID=2773304 RepID=A0ABR9W995_9BACT|nr:relaxase/mobilization nuclease domain-containing protein [Dyadobacter subterraneus]MBE9462059.1 relaxase/mobilization nuclease domain-containing protein [Dyadobacter subterraneus]
MIGRISKTRHLKKTVLYHEKKVEAKTAVLVDAGFYLVDPVRLSLQQKLARFTDRNLLNERSKVNMITFSLSFNPADRPSDLQLGRIASLFLKEVGLDKQPYLVYEHFDTAQQHIHIISTMIRADGIRFDDKKLSIGHFVKSLRTIEAAFNLTSSHAYAVKPEMNSAGANLDQGGFRIRQIKAAINEVLQHYSFSSFSEYNAILKQFNVAALRGSEGSRLFKLGGLLYNTVDKRGKRSCRAIKASNVDARATLKALKAEYFFLRPAQLKNMSRLKNTVDLALIENRGAALDTTAEKLALQGVKMHVSRQDKDDELVLTYLDNRSKCAFDSEMLGENYSLKALFARSKGYDQKVLTAATARNLAGDSADLAAEWQSRAKDFPSYLEVGLKGGVNMMLEDLLAASAGYDPVPYALRKPAKKRKQRRL